MNSITMNMMIQQLKQLLSRRKKRRIVDSGRVPSAVLVPIYSKQSQYYILFTKRTEKVETHKGQISFPGGAYEKGDTTLADTARRECAEEIGIMPGDVEILGELDDQLSLASNFVISPFVALIPWPHQLKLSKDEIDEIIEVPIPTLLEKGCQQKEREGADGATVAGYSYHYDGNIIWGATARILDQFLELFQQVTEEG